LADVAIHGLLEFVIRAILLTDVIERLLPLQGVESAGKNVAFATLVTIPQIGGGVRVNHPRDVDLNVIPRFYRVPGYPLLVCSSGRRLAGAFTCRLPRHFAMWPALSARGAIEQSCQPATAGRIRCRGLGRRSGIPACRKTAGFTPLRRAW